MNKQEIEDWLSSYKITNYTISDDLVVDIHESINLWLKVKEEKLPFQFGTIDGYFSCSYCNLISLEHCPKIVHDDFFCNNNQLTSLEHGPKEIHGDFYCYNNKLTSLEHCPKVVHGRFWCDENLEKDPRYLRWLLAKKLKAL